MSEWWTYRPEDFLLFSPRVYWRLVETYNAEIWPLQLLALVAGLALPVLALLRPASARIAVPLILAAAWLTVAWAFHWSRYATINWAAVYIAAAFAIQALLLLAALALDGLRLRSSGSPLGFGLIGLALLYPVVTCLAGRSWAAAEVFGTASDPTAIATLGILLLSENVYRYVLLPVPLAWCLFSGATLSAMDDPLFWVPPAAATLALTGIAAGRAHRAPI